jgi:hypothetical protein
VKKNKECSAAEAEAEYVLKQTTRIVMIALLKFIIFELLVFRRIAFVLRSLSLVLLTVFVAIAGLLFGYPLDQLIYCYCCFKYKHKHC